MSSMTRPIGYKVPTFIESASEAMAEWKRWIAYANALEAQVSELKTALSETTEYLDSRIKAESCQIQSNNELLGGME